MEGTAALGYNDNKQEDRTALHTRVEMIRTEVVAARRNAVLNKLQAEDRPVHEWFRFVLSYPPHLVRDYLRRFGITHTSLVLDPFCGTGTTLVECKKNGVASVGVEANPMGYLACTVKTDWTPDGRTMVDAAQTIADQAIQRLRADGIEDDSMPDNTVGLSKCISLTPELTKLILKDSISALPLHKTLTLRDCIGKARSQITDHFRVALAKAIVFSISNLHFGPEVGVGKKKLDCAVIAPWLHEVRRIADDLRLVEKTRSCPVRSITAMLEILRAS